MEITQREALTERESELFTRHELTIRKGLKHFIEVGEALNEIRDQRFYRAEFDTFEDYCQARWQMSRRRANQIIESAGTAKLLVSEMQQDGKYVSQTAAPAQLTERHMHALKALPEAERAGAYAEAQQAAAARAKDGQAPKVKQKDVLKVVAKRKARAEAKAEGKPWADFATDVYEVIGELRAAAKHLAKAFDADATGKRLNNRWAHFYSYQGTIQSLNGLIRALEAGLPSVETEQAPGFIPVFQAQNQKAA
jgi:hypothetical protein